MKVAVYGSLRRGLHNHVLLKDSKFVQEFEELLPFEMKSLGSFPALIPSKQVHRIVFELYEVDEDTMQSLDWLEGYPSHYNRKKHNGYWFYFQEKTEGIQGLETVSSGDWKEYYK